MKSSRWAMTRWISYVLVCHNDLLLFSLSLSSHFFTTRMAYLRSAWWRSKVRVHHPTKKQQDGQTTPEYQGRTVQLMWDKGGKCLHLTLLYVQSQVLQFSRPTWCKEDQIGYIFLSHTCRSNLGSFNLITNFKGISASIKDLTRMEDLCKFSLMGRTHRTQRRGSRMLVLAYLWTLFLLARTQSGGISLNQECERTLSDGTIEYLACSASSEALSQLDLSVTVDPVNSTCGLSPDVSRKIYSTLVICLLHFRYCFFIFHLKFTESFHFHYSLLTSLFECFLWCITTFTSWSHFIFSLLACYSLLLLSNCPFVVSFIFYVPVVMQKN